MLQRTAGGALTVAVLGLVGAATACQEEPPPLPSALIVVDTDLAVPRAVSRLRVDLYSEDGTWTHSRDVPLPRADEWPASFGIFSPDESKETAVIVRLRAYAEGALRDYRGERFSARPVFEPPHVSQSLDELCASLTELPPFEERTLRRGPRAITTTTCSYGAGNTATSVSDVGSVGVRVEIPRRDRYRFEVVRSVPGAETGVDTSLSLRRDCLSVSSEVACNDDIDSENYLSRIVAEVDEGSYTLITAGQYRDPADLTLRWAPEAEWDTRVFVSKPPSSQDQAWPRLFVDAKEITPPREPAPAAAVDRVVRVLLTPGVRGRVAVRLGATCAGTGADLPPAAETRIDPSRIRTCQEDGSIGAPADLEPADLAIGVSAAGTFPGGTCTAEDSDDAVVCVPGGAFVMGGPEMDSVFLSDESRTLPVRTVALHRFYIDRREVTVGRFRQARAAGLAVVDRGPIENDGPFDPDSLMTSATYSAKARDRESFPLNGVSWEQARALCKFFGGDLPTEAQWEYAAAAAGLTSKRTYPWGESAPSCDVGVQDRTPRAGTYCKGRKISPEAVDSPSAVADINALGILGLGGNLSELTRDAAQPFDSTCWASKGVLDPSCDDPYPPYRVVRGGNWRATFVVSRAIGRFPLPSVTRTSFVGFRCVYVDPPSTRWSGP